MAVANVTTWVTKLTHFNAELSCVSVLSEVVHQMAKPSFVVGETYQDHNGPYKVISIEGNVLVYAYADGIQHKGDAGIKWTIHCNILSGYSALQSAHLSQRLQSANGGEFFTHAEAFPLIAKAIETYSTVHTDFMKHGEIVQAVMKDPQGQVILERRSDKTKLWLAGCMVAWFSKVFTDGRSDYESCFERKKIGSAWAYRVRQRKN